jgi:hypothetical protein
MAHTRYQEPETGETDQAAPGSRLVVFGQDLTEWRMPAIFAAVSLVVGLLGILIAGQVEPTTHAATPTTAPALSAPPSTVSDSPAITPTTTPAGDAPGTTVEALAPAKVELSTDTVDFGAESIAVEFDMTNTGGEAADWTAVSSSEAIAFSASTGSLPPGETVTLRASLDRTLIAEGELSETITIQWGDSRAEIAVSGSYEDNPIIHNPSASPAELKVSGGGCSPTQATVSARIRDTSNIESVVVRWSPDGATSQETPMISVGNDMFEGVIGPFTAAQSATVRVVAFDEWGNAGGASITVPVTACP